MKPIKFANKRLFGQSRTFCEIQPCGASGGAPGLFGDQFELGINLFLLHRLPEMEPLNTVDL